MRNSATSNWREQDRAMPGRKNQWWHGKWHRWHGKWHQQHRNNSASSRDDDDSWGPWTAATEDHDATDAMEIHDGASGVVDSDDVELECGLDAWYLEEVESEKCSPDDMDPELDVADVAESSHDDATGKVRRNLRGTSWRSNAPKAPWKKQNFKAGRVRRKAKKAVSSQPKPRPKAMPKQPRPKAMPKQPRPKPMPKPTQVPVMEKPVARVPQPPPFPPPAHLYITPPPPAAVPPQVPRPPAPVPLRQVASKQESQPTRNIVRPKPIGIQPMRVRPRPILPQSAMRPFLQQRQHPQQLSEQALLHTHGMQVDYVHTDSAHQAMANIKMQLEATTPKTTSAPVPVGPVVPKRKGVLVRPILKADVIQKRMETMSSATAKTKPLAPALSKAATLAGVAAESPCEKSQPMSWKPAEVGEAKAPEKVAAEKTQPVSSKPVEVEVSPEKAQPMSSKPGEVDKSGQEGFQSQSPEEFAKQLLGMANLLATAATELFRTQSNPKPQEPQ